MHTPEIASDVVVGIIIRCLTRCEKRFWNFPMSTNFVTFCPRLLDNCLHFPSMMTALGEFHMTVTDMGVAAAVTENFSSDTRSKYKGEVTTKRNWLVENLAKVGLFRGGANGGNSALASHPGDTAIEEIPQQVLPSKPTLIHANTFPLERVDVMEADMVHRAESRAMEEEKNETTITLFIRVHHRVAFGHKVLLVGSAYELGHWDPQRGVELAWSAGDMWSGRVDIRRSEIAKLEYKYVVSVDHNVFQWENCKNRYILKAPVRELVVTDQWEFPGFNHGI